MSTATEARIADLRDRLSHCESMAAVATADHDVTRAAVWGSQSRELRAEIKALEPVTFEVGDRVAYWPRGQVVNVEYGVVGSVPTGGLVFVLFDGDSTAKSCDPRDLKAVSR